MKKAWVYIASVLSGVILGMVAMYKLMGDQIEINIRKVKNKGTSGDNSVTIPIDIKSAQDRFKTRKQRKAARKVRKSK